MQTWLYDDKERSLPQEQHSLEFRMSYAATRPVGFKNGKIWESTQDTDAAD